MLDYDKVYRLFLIFADLDEPGGSSLRPLCDAAAAGLESRLAPDADLIRNMERLCVAAAGLAYCDWCSVGGSSASMEEIRIGDIALKSSATAGGKSGVLELRSHFLEEIADLLTSSFVFGRVPS